MLWLTHDFSKSPETFEVVTSIIDVSRKGRRYKVLKVIPHENYKEYFSIKSGIYALNDIALIQVSFIPICYKSTINNSIARSILFHVCLLVMVRIYFLKFKFCYKEIIDYFSEKDDDNFFFSFNF
jgi:hypothetical protein